MGPPPGRGTPCASRDPQGNPVEPTPYRVPVTDRPGPAGKNEKGGLESILSVMLVAYQFDRQARRTFRPCRSTKAAKADRPPRRRAPRTAPKSSVRPLSDRAYVEEHLNVSEHSRSLISRHGSSPPTGRFAPSSVAGTDSGSDFFRSTALHFGDRTESARRTWRRHSNLASRSPVRKHTLPFSGRSEGVISAAPTPGNSNCWRLASG